MSDDPIERLRKRVAGAAKLPTSALGRARRTAGAALKMGLGRLTGKSDVELFEQLAVQLGELKGTAMKAGQILSYLDTELPEEAKRLLAVLQVSSQPTPFAEIAKAAPPELLATMERQPVATASIGQVHRAVLPDGTHVAVKVRHPGIEEAIAADFRSAAAASALPGLLLPGASEVIAEARDTFLAECDYRAERRWQERFGTLYAGHPSITVPAVHDPWCSDRVLVTTWCDGLSFERFCATASQTARDRAGVALYEFYVGSVYRFGLFNGDPHPGNLIFREDGSLIVLDFGCVKEFGPELVRALAALSRAVRADEPSAIRRALVELGAAEPDEKGYAVTLRLLRGFFGPVLTQGPHPVESGLSFDTRDIVKDKLAMAHASAGEAVVPLPHPLRRALGAHSAERSGRLGSAGGAPVRVKAERPRRGGSSPGVDKDPRLRRHLAMPPRSPPRDCPCRSKTPCAACCKPLHRGQAPAPTPEALMRSRFAGFALGLGDYLVETLATHHPDRSLNPNDLPYGRSWHSS